MTSNFSNHSLFYYESGDVYSFGCNDFGELGFPVTDEVEFPNPKLVMSDKEIRTISAGNDFTIILKYNGDIYGFGSNEKGQLGLDKSIIKVESPKFLMRKEGIKELKTGAYYTILIFENGDIYYFGGLYDEPCFQPKLLSSEPNLKLVSCGAEFLMILKRDGQLLFCGKNEEVCVKNLPDIVLEPTLVMKDEKIKQICCGWFFCLILKENGDLLAFGSNQYGQLGRAIDEDYYLREPTLILNDKTINSIYACSHSSYFSLDDGTLKGAGYNQDGEVFSSEDTNVTTYTTIMKNENVRNISFGWGHVIFQTINGDIFGFGCNSSGQLGRGHKEHLKKIEFFKNDPSLLIAIAGERQNFEWSHEKHCYYSNSFRKGVRSFVLCLKRKQKQTNLKIPKFLIFEIIKKVKFFGSSVEDLIEMDAKNKRN